MAMHQSRRRLRGRVVTAIGVSAVIGVVATACSSSGKPSATATSSTSGSSGSSPTPAGSAVSSGPAASGASTSSASSAASSPSTPLGTKTLTVASSAAGLAPDFSTYTQLELMVYDDAVYDFPMHLNADTDAIEPWAVTSWSYDASKTALTLNLRPGMTFSDGTPVNGAALKANFDQRVTLKDASFDYTNIASVDAPTDTQTVINLKTPDATFLPEVAMTHISAPSAITSKDSPIGSGPYILDKSKSVSGSSYVFTRNPHYWNASAFPYGTIVDKVVADVTARTNALLSGQVDYAAIDANSAVAVKAKGLQVIQGEGDSTTFLIADRAGKIVPALGDLRVRQALNYAIDRNAIDKSIDLGNGNATSQYFLPGSPYHFDGPDTYTYDPAKAKALLAQAGYPNGFNMGTLPSLFFPAYEPAVTQYFAAIGVKVQFSAIPLEKSLPLVLAGKYAGFVWGDSMPNPGLEMRPDGIWNGTHFSTPQLVSLWKTIDTGDPAASAQGMQDLAKYIYQNAWFVQLGHTPAYFAADKSLSVKPAGAYSITGFDGAYLWDMKPAS